MKKSMIVSLLLAGILSVSSVAYAAEDEIADMQDRKSVV